MTIVIINVVCFELVCVMDRHLFQCLLKDFPGGDLSISLFSIEALFIIEVQGVVDIGHVRD